MIFEKTTLSFSSGTRYCVPVIYNFLRTYSDRFSLDGNYIILDNEFKFTIDGTSQYPTTMVVCNDSNNTTLTLDHFGRWNRVSSSTTGIVQFLLTSSVFYFSMTQGNDRTCYGEILAFTDVDNNHFFGTKSYSYDANNANFYNVDTAFGTYNIGLMLKFATQSEKILWSNICPVSYDGGYFSNVSTLINCSNITQGIVITMNGKNYFTLGTNILVCIDD